jgi:GNAT superfamily N-acetyltransferase
MAGENRDRPPVEPPPLRGIVSDLGVDQEMKIEVTETPDAADMEFLSRGIQAFNKETVPGLPEVSQDLKFAVFARDERGKVVGGIRANAFWGYLCIELLWLSEEARGSGAGKQLVERAETFAVEHGFRHARVETTSFQAKPFYEKLGYEVYGVLDDFPEGHTSFYLRKDLQAG